MNALPNNTVIDMAMSLNPIDGEEYGAWLKRITAQVCKELQGRTKTVTRLNFTDDPTTSAEPTTDSAEPGPASTKPSHWFDDLSPREQKEVQFSQEYRENYAHGTDGHSRLMLIDHLATLLYKAEAARDRTAIATNDRENVHAEERKRLNGLVAHFEREAKSRERECDNLAQDVNEKAKVIASLRQVIESLQNEVAAARETIAKKQDLINARDNIIARYAVPDPSTTTAHPSSVHDLTTVLLYEDVLRALVPNANHRNTLRGYKPQAAYQKAISRLMDFTELPHTEAQLRFDGACAMARAIAKEQYKA